MKTSFLTLAAAALLLAGCSKEELTENVAEGVSTVATPISQQKNRGGNFHVWTEIWFNENQGRIMVKMPPRWTHVQITATASKVSAVGNDDSNNPSDDFEVIESPLNRVGNSRIYRSEQDQFVFGQTSYFSLVDVTLSANTFVDDWQGETTYLKLFLYPSGRTVEQDPKIFLRRFHVQETIAGEWDETISAELEITIADDPAQEVMQLKFVPDPIYGNPDDPTAVTYLEPIYLEKTHENQNLGLSRWVGSKKYPKEDSYSGTVYMLNGGGDYMGNFNFRVEG